MFLFFGQIMQQSSADQDIKHEVPLPHAQIVTVKKIAKSLVQETYQSKIIHKS